VFQMYTRSLHDALPISHEPFGGTEAEAGGAFLDDEGADPLGAGFVGEAGVDEVEVGFTAVGDPPFGSGDDVAVAGGAGRGAHVGCGRSGVGLGNSDRHGLLTGDDVRQPAFALLFSPQVVDHLGRTGVGLEDLE